jgi:hypothetical protein
MSRVYFVRELVYDIFLKVHVFENMVHMNGKHKF